VCEAHSMSMSFLGGLGVALPENFENQHSEIEFRGNFDGNFLTVLSYCHGVKALSVKMQPLLLKIINLNKCCNPFMISDLASCTHR